MSASDVVEVIGIGEPVTGVSRFNQNYLKPNVGLLLLFAAQFFNSLMVVSTKVLETEADGEEEPIMPLQILCVRMGITYVGALMYMYAYRSKIKHVPLGAKGVRKWLVLRGLTGFFGVFGMYFSLMYLSISDAVLITFLAPTVTVFLAWILLREPFTRAEVLGTVVSLCGVILIVRPVAIFGAETEFGGGKGAVESTDSKDRIVASLVGLFGVLGMSLVYIIIRHIGDRAHAIMSVSYFSLITGIISFIGIQIIPKMHFERPRSNRQWFLLINLGFCGFLYQLLLTIGIQRERAGRGSLVAYTQLLYAIFWDVTLFGHWPNLLSWLGTILIVGSTVVVAARRETANLPQASSGGILAPDTMVTREDEVLEMQKYPSAHA